MEVWASPEPTVARVDRVTVRDQLAETGHEARDGDIGLIASLGVSGSRYPVLWEKTAPVDPRRPDLRWARRRLEGLRAAGVAPIVTLVHHGSGPLSTSLVDADFADGLGAYAGAVADAFGWVRRWTPINEPLTTARFSALYGTWYPNARDDVAFAQAIVGETFATIAAMEAIRERNPQAELVLTEDLQSFLPLDSASEPAARHQSERMYLSVELLMGRIVPGHPMHAYLTGEGNVSPARLREIAARATPPDLLAWNYYPNSERALSAARDGAPRDEPRRHVARISPRPLLRAQYERLGLPFALGEVHVNADEAARVRWLAARHDDLAALAREGFPVRALGAWAAFGLVDWDSLLTRREGYGEDGIFTLAAPDETPRETEVARAVRALARGESLVAPVANEPDWWEVAAGEPVRAV